MKTILTLLTILGAQFVATPNAEARDCSSHRYVTSRTSCGCPIYTVRYVAYYDRCGHPVYRYRTEPIRHRCNHARHQHPVYRQTYYNHPRHQVPARSKCGSSRSVSWNSNGITFRFHR